MSSVQTSQLISLLANNVLMVIIVMTLTIVAWLRWHWLRAVSRSTRATRRRCRKAYVSFVLSGATLLGLLMSLGLLTLRSMVALNALVIGAMGIFLLSVITLLVALGLCLFDLCQGRSPLPAGRRSSKNDDFLHVSAMALMPAPMAMGAGKRAQRRQRRQRHSKPL